MSAVGSFGSAPPLCRPAQGPAGKQVGLESNPPRPTDSLTSSSSLPPLQFPGVPLSGKYSLPSAKGKPWKMLLYASSGQRNFVSKANVYPKGLCSRLPSASRASEGCVCTPRLLAVSVQTEDWARGLTLGPSRPRRQRRGRVGGEASSGIFLVVITRVWPQASFPASLVRWVALPCFLFSRSPPSLSLSP